MQARLSESSAYYSCNEHFSDVGRRNNMRELSSQDQSSAIACLENHFDDTRRNVEGNPDPG